MSEILAPSYDNHLLLQKTGRLDVGHGDSIAYWLLGNPDGPTLHYYHGGPGGTVSADPSHQELISVVLSSYNVLMFDQRACGLSTPAFNRYHAIGDTALDAFKLIQDSVALRDHLDIKDFYTMGGSYGSTLALLDGIEHMQSANEETARRLKGMLTWSVTLGEKQKSIVEHATGSDLTEAIPKAWERFISLVPEEIQHDGAAVMRYYHQKMTADPQDHEGYSTAQEYAAAFGLLHISAALQGDARDFLTSYTKDMSNLDLFEASKNFTPDPLAYALYALTFEMNGGGLPDNYILHNLVHIQHLPLYVISGLEDPLTPKSIAQELVAAYGPNAHHALVPNAGHDRADSRMMAQIQKSLVQLTRH